MNSTCNFLSAITSIPQTILFGRSPAGFNATGYSDFENWYNYVERIQKRMIKSNLRYLLSILFQIGVYTGEIEKVPKIKIKFNPLWSLSELEQADLEQKKLSAQLTKAQIARIYVDINVLDPLEVRRGLEDIKALDINNIAEGGAKDE